MNNYHQETLNEFLNTSEVRKNASPETWEILTKPFVKVPNTDAGYGIAQESFQEAMEHDLGTDEGDAVHLALEQKRWSIQSHFKSLYGWDID
jgi:hypothetical protein